MVEISTDIASVIRVLALGGRSINHILLKTGVPKKEIKEFLHDPQNGFIWHWPTARRNNSIGYRTARDKIDSLKLNGQTDNIEFKAWEQTASYFADYPETISPAEEVAKVLTAYYLAKEKDRKIKFDELASIGSISRNTICRVLKRLNLDSMYREVKRHNIMSSADERRVTIGLNETNLAYSDLATLLEVDRCAVQRRARRGNPLTPRNARISDSRLLYSTVSKIYELSDQGISRAEIMRKIKEGDNSRRVTLETIEGLISSREEYAPLVTSALQVIYRDETLTTPYWISRNKRGKRHTA